MIDLEKSAAARLPAANVWLERGEGLAGAAMGAVHGIKRALARVVSSLERAARRRAAMRELYRLDDRLLRDIGLRRDQVAEMVDGMFRRADAGAATRAIGEVVGEVVASGSEAITEVNAGNDRHYRSAA